MIAPSTHPAEASSRYREIASDGAPWPCAEPGEMERLMTVEAVSDDCLEQAIIGGLALVGLVFVLFAIRSMF